MYLELAAKPKSVTLKELTFTPNKAGSGNAMYVTGSDSSVVFNAEFFSSLDLSSATAGDFGCGDDVTRDDDEAAERGCLTRNRQSG